MEEEKVTTAVNILLAIASTSLFYGLSYYITEEHQERQKEAPETKQELDVILPTKESKPHKAAPIYDLWNDFDNIYIQYETMETEFLGYYFITAYCPEECGGSWQTSSGETCHYSERWSEPTTCAIDSSIHGYNELLLIGDPEDADKKIYVTEDTGPGVRGLWVDCFVETMEEVNNWDTGWRPVYAVTYEKHVISIKRTRWFYESFRNYLLMRCDSRGVYFRHDSRADG